MRHLHSDDEGGPPRTRRAVLLAVAAGTGLLGIGTALAACGSTAPAASGTTTTSPAPAGSSTAATSARASATPAASQSTAQTSAAASAPAGKGLTLEIASWEKTEPAKQAYAQIFAAYAKVKPDVTLQQQVIPNTLADYNSKVTAQIAGGTAPDLMEAIWGLSQGLSVKGALQPLDPLIQRDKISTTDYLQTALELGRWPQGSGKYYAWYTMFSTSPLFYNTAIFQAAGQPPPDATWTWDHLLEVAQRLTKKGATPQDSTFGFNLTYLTRTLLYSYGWDFTSPDLSQCFLDSPQSLDGMQFWQDLIYKYQVSPTPADQLGKGQPAGPFSSKRLGMEIQASYQVGAYRKVDGLEWDIALPPSGPAGRLAILKGAPGHALPSQSPHPTEAWDFLSWWIRNQTADMVILPGNLPSRLSALNDYAAQEKKNNKVPAHIDLLYEIATKYTKPVQVLPNNDVVKDPYYKERALILDNKEDVKTGMTKACQAMMGLLKQATMGK